MNFIIFSRFYDQNIIYKTIFKIRNVSFIFQNFDKNKIQKRNKNEKIHMNFAKINEFINK